ncbi:MAG: Ig-like domain-containing protein [Flavobacteriaceae bacterium]
MKIVRYFFLAFLVFSCENPSSSPKNIVTSDIDHFWEAYDKIIATEDSTLQYQWLDSLYFQKGTKGLHAIREARNYTPKDYIDAINNYPKFWNSVRKNTLKANTFAYELEQGIENLRQLYPDLKPAKIYFTIGALRTNGTTLDSLVLLGSELAMTDKNTVVSEFPEPLRSGRRAFFDRNPIDNLVLLNVHEYVHTQQKPALENLLSFSIREGVAEFVSCKAMGVPSSTPAVSFGKNNDAVRQKFERELFYGNNLYQWLWSDSPNEFGVRDLGYYIGYELSERYYTQASDKNQAIKNLIELDYTNEKEVEEFVNGTGFFSNTLENLYQDYENRRPIVKAIQPFQNNSEKVNPKTNQITVVFSEPMNEEFRNFDYGPLGEEAVVRFKELIGYSEDGTMLTFEIEPLEPNKQYQLLIGWGFRNLENVPLKPYLIDFKTDK